MNIVISTRYLPRLSAAALALSLTLGAGTVVAQSSLAAQEAAVAAGANFWLPDTAADPHLKNFQLPVYIDLPSGTPGCSPDQLTVEIAFNATRFFPRTVSRGSIIRNVVENGNRVLEISLAGSEPMSKGALTVITGDVLLGDVEIIPLELRSVKCGGVPVADSVEGGYLRMRGDYCEEGSDRVLVYRAGFGISKIAPNPSNGPVRVEILGVEFARTTLEIYSSFGEKVYASSWHPTSEPELRREITLPSDIPAGHYELVLRSPGRYDVKSLIISK